MKIFLRAFRSDFKNFVRSNLKVLVVCLITVLLIQFLEKGNLVINLSVITLHILGDIFMILSLTKHSVGDKKAGAIYQLPAILIFIVIGIIAIMQSTEGKNWQYLLGTFPFVVACIFQILDAWNKKGKGFFNYKLTIFVTIILALVYHFMDLVYDHTWLFIFGYSLFPILLAIEDSPKIYIGRVFSVFIMIIGVLLDIKFYYITKDIIPASAISSFFITLIAFFGFISNASMYKIKHEKLDRITKNILDVLVKIEKAM